MISLLRVFEKKKTWKPSKHQTRPLIFDYKEQRDIARWSLRNRKFSRAMLRSKFFKKYKKSISLKTISRIQAYFGIRTYKCLRKYALTPAQKAVRLKWANEFLHFTKKDWRRVIFSDESKFSQYYDGKQFCYRRVGEDNLPDAVHYIQPRFGVSTMAWGAISYYGVSNLVFCDSTLDSIQYQRILQQNLLPFLNEHSDKLIFQQDNAPCHKSKSIKEYFNKSQIRVIWWPPYSPDLNPIENIWAILKRRMSLLEIDNKQILQQVIQDQWKLLSDTILKNLVDSMKQRCLAVIEAEGETIKY